MIRIRGKSTRARGSIEGPMTAMLCAALALAGCGRHHKLRIPIIGNPAPDPAPAPAPGPAGQLRFSIAAVTVGETAGTASATIERVGGSAGAVSVTVTSADAEGSATAGEDYEALATTITFA